MVIPARFIPAIPLERGSETFKSAFAALSLLRQADQRAV